MVEFLTTTLGAAIKSLATKAVSSPVEGMARRALKAVDGKPVDEATAAVGKAVEAARRDLVNDYWAGEDALSRDVVTLLRHPPFAEAVVRRLLFHGQPDFDRLRRAYLKLGEPEEQTAAGERWQALQVPLAIFIEAVEQHLEADPLLGPLLRDSRMLAALNRLETNQRIVAETSREIQRYQQRAARAAETGSDHLADLVALAGDGNATLGRILERLTEQLDRLAPNQEDEGEAPESADDDLLPSEERYLRLLRRECNRLPLADDPRDVSTKHVERPELANVYIDLETTNNSIRTRVLYDRLGGSEEDWPRFVEAMHEQGGVRFTYHNDEDLSEDHPLRSWAEDEETLNAARRPLTALEALVENPYLVLLGDPGSGKSTFVNHLAVTLACRRLGDDADPLDTPSGPLSEPWLPVRIVLRRWSASLRTEAVEEDRELELLYQALADLPGDVPRDRWLERFDDPHTLVLFDGLDEVPAGGEGEIDRRQVIVAAIEAFRTAHPTCRMLVTCRVKPYGEGTLQLDKCPTYELAVLDDDRIHRFCGRWYDELARVGRLLDGEAENRRERLLAAFGDRPVLREMAGTPLLLTMLARVNARARLPESRAELYGECVEQLLWEWERQKRGGVDSLASLLEQPGAKRSGAALKRADFERVLWQLTWEAHGDSGKDGTVDLPFATLREALARVHPERDPGWAWANRVLELMRERGGLLVEARSGVFTFPHRSFQEYLACRWLLEKGDAPSTTARRFAADDTWGEVILLSCGYLASRGRFDNLQAIIAELVAGDQPSEPEDWRRVLVAGRAWLEFGPHRAQGHTGEALTSRVSPLLARLMQNSDLPSPQRLEAGVLASDLGDLPPHLDAWVEIPPDTLDYPFRIGKYPVTNAQFRRFVAAGGYDREQGWFSEEAQREISKWEGRSHHGWPVGPGYKKHSRSNHATLPVTGVSWFEAAAYAKWLTEALRQAGDIEETEMVRLATVDEWQRAGGGTDNRTYSWEGEFDLWRANTLESSLNGLTPVHMHPAGATPEGLFDLTGNVWEWTANKIHSISYQLAGGAFYLDRSRVGAAARARCVRHRRNGNVGFRVVVVPASRVDPSS